MVCMNFRACPMLRKFRVVLFSPNTMKPCASSNSTLPLPRCMVMKVGSLCFFISWTTPSARPLIFLAMSLGFSFSLSETLTFTLFLSAISVHLLFPRLPGRHGFPGLPGLDSATALDALFFRHLGSPLDFGFDGFMVFLELLGLDGFLQLQLVQYQFFQVLFQVLLVFPGYLAQRGRDLGDVLQEHLALQLLLGFLALGDDVPARLPQRLHEGQPDFLHDLGFLGNGLLARRSIGDVPRQQVDEHIPYTS